MNWAENRIFLYIISSLIIVYGCNQTHQNKQELKNNKSIVKYAQYFDIFEYKNGYKLQIINPDNGNIEKTFFVNKHSINKEKNQIKVPIKSIICLSGTDIGYINKLNKIEKIKGISQLKYLHDKTLKKKVLNKTIKEWNDIHSLSPEKIYKESSILSYSGMGKTIEKEKQFQLLNIHTLPNYDWRETHPLGKAEWIKMYALLFDNLSECDKLFRLIEKRYKHLKEEAKKIIQKSKIKPSILSGSLISEFWYMPAGDSYFAQIISDAGGDYIAKNNKGTGSAVFTIEQVVKQYRHTQIWINPMFYSSREMKKASQVYTLFDAFANKQVYCYSHQINSFWENSASEPDKILSDLIEIFHHRNKKKMYFYKKISF
ncbi:MAG: ABC transporter substrate-binding protein [Flavobacteriia bacterium]|nr:ABC transporter substrate-binding protein [Flavobacteriia bacterium]